MPMHRANSTKGAQRGAAVGDGMSGEAHWFSKNRQKERNRRRMAKASKRKNRK